mmetsp:Transcript_28559/g.48541  ORF Transcript_28559/g.48541 Transcript_28559/m.48541 type:complete len:245 (-) Transcript_28559:406-1140(-)
MYSTWSANDTTFSNFKWNTLGRNLSVFKIISKQVLQFVSTISDSSGIPQNGWSIIESSTSSNHISQLNLITRTHDGQIWNTSQVGQIITSMVSRTIISNNSRTVQYHSHGQILDSNIMNNLIITSLHECRVNATEWFQSLTRHTCRKSHSMLLGNTHIKCPLRESSSEDIHTSSTGHSSSDSHNSSVLSSRINERVGKYGSEARCRGLSFLLNTRGNVELTHTVHTIGGCKGRWITLSLVSLDV